jgi:hypothetical protein
MCLRQVFSSVLLLQMMWAAISIIGMLFMQPTDPGKVDPLITARLQQFSWTEAALEASIQVRTVGVCTASMPVSAHIRIPYVA